MAVAGSGSPRARRTRASRARVSTAAAPAPGDRSPDDAERPGQERLAWLDIPRSGKISETIARDILDDIVVRKLPPGTMLASEAVMLDRYGVGRASLREALRILEIHGLIKIKPGPRGGPVVAEVTSSDLGRSATFYFHAVGATFADLLGARLAIEPLMAGLAASQSHRRGGRGTQSRARRPRAGCHPAGEFVGAHERGLPCHRQRPVRQQGTGPPRPRAAGYPRLAHSDRVPGERPGRRVPGAPAHRAGDPRRRRRRGRAAHAPPCSGPDHQRPPDPPRAA